MTTSPTPSPSYLRIIARRWWLILLLPLVTAAVIIILSRAAPVEYQAAARLQIVVVDSQEVALFSQTRFTGSAEQIQTVHDEFFDVLRLQSVARRTIAELGLTLSPADLVARLDSQHANDFITVSLRLSDPAQAQQALAAHIDNAIRTYRNIRATPAQLVADFIGDQITDQALKLADARRALQKFQLENEISDLDREILAYQDLRRSLRSDRARAAVEAQRAESLAAEFNARAAANFAQAAALETELPTAPAESEPETEAAVADPALLAEIEELRSLARSQRRGAEEQRAIAAGHAAAIAVYDRLLEERQQELVYLLGLQERYNALQVEVSRAERDYNFLIDKANEATLKLSQGQAIGYLQVIEPPRLPDAALPQATLQLLAVGLLISLLAALILAFLLETLEHGLASRS